MKITQKIGFTLAEVLITLGVIGIVAVLTIPGLMNNINDKVVENQKKVLNAKIVQGLNMFNSQENGLTKTYANSEEFVRGLSKYMKMTTICGKDNLDDCFGYEEIRHFGNGYCTGEFQSGDCEVKSTKLTTLNAMKLRLGINFLDIAAFVMGDGSTVLVSWNSKCAGGAKNAIVLDPDQPLKTIPAQCFDGIYDINGASRPNFFDKDVFSFGRATVGVNYFNNEIPGVGTVINIGQVVQPDAKKICSDLDMKLPDVNTLKTICTKKSQYPELFGGSNIWSSEEVAPAWNPEGHGARVVSCHSNGNSSIYEAYLYDTWHEALCVSK